MRLAESALGEQSPAAGQASVCSTQSAGNHTKVVVMRTIYHRISSQLELISDEILLDPWHRTLAGIGTDKGFLLWEPVG